MVAVRSASLSQFTIGHRDTQLLLSDVLIENLHVHHQPLFLRTTALAGAIGVFAKPGGALCTTIWP